MRPLSEPPRAEVPGDEESAASTGPLDERENFAALVRAELDWVWRLLRRIGLSSADADDATQQVFLVAARRSSEVQGSSARPFLYGTALRVAANARRTLRRRRDVPNETAQAAAVAGEPLPDELLEQRRARELLDALLAQMSPELRRVLVLSEIEQLTAKQIGELEGLPAGTVASRLRRARSTFDDLLARSQRRRPARGGRS
ncbi:MAG: sigma-70 family RNA polymerase sigma factor [Polyangiaceae bacterium]